jgi:hypothetical protein
MIAGNNITFLLDMTSADVLLVNIWTSATLQAAALFVRGVEYNFFLVPQVRALPRSSHPSRPA